MRVVDPSAVALIEAISTDSFVLERRPDLPGVINAGKFGFFGGHREPGEPAEAAVRRELWEEVEFSGDVTLLWSGFVHARDGEGRAAARSVSLYGAKIMSVAELNLQTPGEIVEVGRSIEAIEVASDRMPAFVVWALTACLKANGEPWLGMDDPFALTASVANNGAYAGVR